VCDVCGKVGHGRAKGWHEAFDIPPIVAPNGEEFVNARRFQSARFHRRGSGGRFVCPSCTEREHGLELVALHMLRALWVDSGQGREARD
jgi:hypothetical protein